MRGEEWNRRAGMRPGATIDDPARANETRTRAIE
jgi:hypothetical protein